MPTIGNRTDAQTAVDLFENEDYPGDHFLDSGYYRTVYAINDVVYKVEREQDRGYSNATEYRHARFLAKAVTAEGIRIPKVSMFTIRRHKVLAMERVVGTKAEHAKNVSASGLRALFFLGFEDMHQANFFVEKDGTVVPIDMASPRNASKAMRRSDARVLWGVDAVADLAKDVERSRHMVWCRAEVRGWCNRRDLHI